MRMQIVRLRQAVLHLAYAVGLYSLFGPRPAKVYHGTTRSQSRYPVGYACQQLSAATNVEWFRVDTVIMAGGTGIPWITVKELLAHDEMGNLDESLYRWLEIIAEFHSSPVGWH